MRWMMAYVVMLAAARSVYAACPSLTQAEQTLATAATALQLCEGETCTAAIDSSSVACTCTAERDAVARLQSIVDKCRRSIAAEPAGIATLAQLLREHCHVYGDQDTCPMIDGMQVCYPEIGGCDGAVPESCHRFAHTVGPQRYQLERCFLDLEGARPSERVQAPRPSPPRVPVPSRPPSVADVEANRAKWLALLDPQQQKRVAAAIDATKPPAHYVDTWIQGSGATKWSQSKECDKWAQAVAENDAHDQCFMYSGGFVIHGSIKQNKVWLQSHWTGRHFVYQCSTTANLVCRHPEKP